MTVHYFANSGTHANAQLRGSKPMQRHVNNVVNKQTAQEQADAIEQAIYDNIAAFEADKLQKEQEAAALFGQRADVALKLADSKPGTTITLSDGTVVRR
jgi:hypothetical protein